LLSLSSHQAASPRFEGKSGTGRFEPPDRRLAMIFDRQSRLANAFPSQARESVLAA
jgi:hypothetical protein